MKAYNLLNSSVSTEHKFTIGMTSLDLSVYLQEETLSPQQKKFNRLIKKIDQLKLSLADWQQVQQQVQQDAANELLPLYPQWHQILFQQLETLWQQKNAHKFAKTHLERLDEKIKVLLGMLINNPNISAQQQTFINEIVEFYKIKITSIFPSSISQEDMEAPMEEVELAEENADDQIIKQAFKAMLSDQLGLPEDWIDFDFDPQNPEDFMQKVKAKLDREEDNFIQSQLNEDEREEYQKFAEKEKKKMLKKQTQLEEAQKIAGQSLKSIYSKIAALIHPDREQDEQKRIEKTELLQQANAALEEKDLLTLLKLRAYTEQDDQKQAVKIANEHLKSYNLLLEDQIEQLQFEVDEIVYSFDWEMSGFYKQTFKPADLTKKYQRDLADIQKKLVADQKLLTQYQDITILKTLLKSRMFSWTFM